VQHAILDGRAVSGVTVFRLDEGVDTGPILSSRQIQIDEHVTSGELLSELTEVGSDLLIQTLRDFESLAANQRNQPVVSSLKMAGKLSRADAKIDVYSAATEVHNLVRAMNPEPIAWFEINGNPIRVLRTAIADSPKLPTGELCLQGGELFLGCKSGSLKLLRVQPAGKAEMSGADWFRGLRQESISIS
jgi:methionyl-tRNA formyltransferase